MAANLNKCPKWIGNFIDEKKSFKLVGFSTFYMTNQNNLMY